MAGNRVIEVELPAGADPTGEDLDLLRGIFSAVVMLRFGAGRPLDDAEQMLAGEGWTVQARLAWSAEARKGGELEQVTGPTRGDALKHLLQLVRADRVMSAP